MITLSIFKTETKIRQIYCRGGSETHPYNPTTKPIALGGMTNPFLSAAMVSTKRVVEAIELVKMQIEVTFFSNANFESDKLNLQER